jgi:hypothetical protein
LTNLQVLVVDCEEDEYFGREVAGLVSLSTIIGIGSVFLEWWCTEGEGS